MKKPVASAFKKQKNVAGFCSFEKSEISAQ